MNKTIRIPGVYGEVTRSDAPFIGEVYEKVLITGTGKHGDGLFKNDANFVIIVKGSKQDEVVSCEILCIIKNAALAKITKRWPKEPEVK